MPTDQIKKLVGTLSVRQGWTLAAAAVLVAAAIYSFLRFQQDSSFRPLYTNMAAEDAALVVQKLKETGVTYRLSNNGTTISVPDEKVAETRLEMAGAGLPKDGRIGFELFDKTNFGMTEFAEHVNYRRALEGELERSVMSVAEIEQARVHISLPQESVFLEARQPAKASVLVKIRRGAALPDTAIPAITNLVASAVEGLSPDAVSVLDMRGNLLNRPKKPGANDDSSAAALEYRHKVEQDLVAKLESTLEPLVGAGRFRAAASADCDMNSGEQSEETFDPTHSVMVSSQKTEDVTTQARAATGVPGTASNLPDEAPKPPAPAPSSSRKTENVNYQTSHTVKRTVLPEGTIRRLSVSVLLDYDVSWENGTKRVLTPPSTERLDVIRNLVSAAVGLNSDRGDQLIVESLPFESTLNLEPPVSQAASGAASTKKLAPIAQLKQDPKLMIGLAGIAVVVVAIVVLAIVRMRRPERRKPVEVAPAETLLQPTVDVAAQPILPPDREEPAEAPPAPAVRVLAPARTEVLANQIRSAVQNNSEVCAGVLRGWMAEKV